MADHVGRTSPFENFMTDHTVSPGIALAIKILTGAGVGSTYIWNDGTIDVNTYQGDHDRILAEFPGSHVHEDEHTPRGGISVRIPARAPHKS